MHANRGDGQTSDRHCNCWRGTMPDATSRRARSRMHVAACASVGGARPPEALRGAAEAAGHAGVELGRDQDEDVVAEEGQRHRAQQRQREQPGPPVRGAPSPFAPLCWLWPGREARVLGARGGPRGLGGSVARVVAEGRAGHGVREVTRHHVTGFLC